MNATNDLTTRDIAIRDTTTRDITIRSASITDLAALTQLENACFSVDKLSQRSFRYHIKSEHSLLVIAEGSSSDAQASCNESESAYDGTTFSASGAKPSASKVLAYALCLLNKGTRLSRLYSIAVLQEAQGLALGRRLVEACESWAKQQGRLYMRLEVAEDNAPAIRLYQSMGYRQFGEFQDYYEDHQDALRMQKTIRHRPASLPVLSAQWYQQTTDFTCGPASLLMAMSALGAKRPCTQLEELAIWRESTTIFMTSGLGGTHPFGLALAAQKRGYCPEVYINQQSPLFLDGVRSEHKKNIMTLVHEAFTAECSDKKLAIHYQDVGQQHVQAWLDAGKAVIALISTYRLDGRKAPHWVLITGADEECFYLHDPDVDDTWQQAIDCQHVPVARKDFDKMSAFGSQRLRCMISLEAK